MILFDTINKKIDHILLEKKEVEELKAIIP
jgi:hypothetical protein